MKKLIAYILMIIMMAALASCGSAQVPAQIQTAAPESSGQTAEQGSDQSAQSSPEQSSGASSEQGKEETKPEEPDKPAYDVDGLLIAECEGARLTIEGVEESWTGGVQFNILCENLTSDKTLMYSIDDTAVNGYMIGSFFANEVAPGKKAFEDLSFSSSDLSASGITSCDKVELKLRVYDSNDWSAAPLIEDRFAFYPTGLSDEEIVIPDRPTTEGEMIVEDNENFDFIILGAETSSLGGYRLNCYMENKTDKTLMYTWDETSVNGFMIDPFWARSVSPGCRLRSDISFSSSKLKENHIDTVEEIEFKLKVYDNENWLGKDRFEKVFTITITQ